MFFFSKYLIESIEPLKIYQVSDVILYNFKVFRG